MRTLLMGFGFLCLAMLTGCIASTVDPDELEVNGKVGWACSVPAGVVGVGLDVVCAPITLPLAVIGQTYKEPEDDTFFWAALPSAPGYVLEDTVYAAATVATYPVYLVGIAGPRAVRLAAMDRDEAVRYLIARLPEVSETNYAKLAAASGRSFAPPYVSRYSAGAGLGDRAVVDDRIAAEWQAWLEAGEPAGGPQEAAFVLENWVVELNPYPVAGPFGEAGAPTLERIAGATRQEVERYAESNREKRLRAQCGPWKFWVAEHGGVQKVVDQAHHGDTGDTEKGKGPLTQIKADLHR